MQRPTPPHSIPSPPLRRLTLLLALLLWAPTGLWAAGAPLTLWVGSDKGYQGLELIGRNYTARTGVEVRVRHFDDLPAAFESSAPAGGGPDILLWAHDRYGEWAQRGWIAPVDPSPAFKRDIAPFTWDAVTTQGRIYGYPIAVEAVGLIYNRQYIPAPPGDFEDLFALDWAMKRFGMQAIAWNYAEPYFSWSLLAAHGGYAFKRNDGDYDTGSTGVNTSGAVKGARMLARLIEAGVLAPDNDSDAVLDAFVHRRVAMMINGPWVWGELRRRGIDFGVAAIPRLKGAPAKPFVGVWAAAITSASRRKAEAVDFIEHYMLSLTGLKTLNTDAPLGAAANRKLMGELAADPNIDATFENAAGGQTMPNIPEMGRFWSALKTALQAIAAGTPPQLALDRAAAATVNPAGS